MSLKEQISEDMKAAMRAKESERLATIRLLMAAIRHLGPPPSHAATAAMLTAALEALCPTPTRVETPN